MANDMATGEVRPQTDDAEALLKEAADLESRATHKERQARADWCSSEGAVFLERDADTCREKAAAKRAKAQQLCNPGRVTPQKEECRG
ncbi:hypothetical protein D7V80_11835 [Corallococcus sp. CA054B]|uniref:hypothetical protein n=1 Tax=Corallococcus sp. CA054B TaxID=2316734 RepID=UPI000EA25665|nr:hypothetical protein [Corallococcus sp. CA054B]RKG68680.1 hypothetical protein D7V80_11835 [Corallococcus sp. CA054B]